jgi:CheY-like chemotaxis protein
VAGGAVLTRPQPAPEHDQSVGGRVLVVEDNAEVGEFASQMLIDLGFEAILVENAKAAIERLEGDEGGFDLIFSDVVMPGMDGVEFGRIVRDRWPAIVVVLTSGYSHILAEEPQHGFTILQKPYSVETFSNTLREARQLQSSR